MLFWVDEFAWLTASRDFPGYRLVTRGMDRISFEQSVVNGSILRFHILPVKKGSSSVRYQVDVYADEPGAVKEKLVFSTVVTFVSIACKGEKTLLPSRDVLRSQIEDFDQTPYPGEGGGPAGVRKDS